MSIRRDRPDFTGNNRLMFITNNTSRYSEVEQVRMAVEGGCSWIQLRMKDGIDIEVARECAKICSSVKERVVDFCIDDDVEAAIECGATSCHLGKNDMPVDEAWRLLDSELGKDKRFYVGATANTFEDIELAVSRGASYIGLGPYRFTDTKKNLSPILGLEGYRDIVSRCRAAGIDIPIFAIGGITIDDVAPLMKTGVTGLAVSSVVTNAESPSGMIRDFILNINLSTSGN